jgi:hypothetical protein
MKKSMLGVICFSCITTTIGAIFFPAEAPNTQAVPVYCNFNTRYLCPDCQPVDTYYCKLASNPMSIYLCDTTTLHDCVAGRVLECKGGFKFTMPSCTGDITGSCQYSVTSCQ